jgi:hypothetical protein
MHSIGGMATAVTGPPDMAYVATGCPVAARKIWIFESKVPTSASWCTDFMLMFEPPGGPLSESENAKVLAVAGTRSLSMGFSSGKAHSKTLWVSKYCKKYGGAHAIAGHCSGGAMQRGLSGVWIAS